MVRTWAVSLGARCRVGDQVRARRGQAAWRDAPKNIKELFAVLRREFGRHDGKETLRAAVEKLFQLGYPGGAQRVSGRQSLSAGSSQ
jgi:hypothetical protein